MTPLSIWERNIIKVDRGDFFNNWQFFDGVSGKEIPNKFTKFETLVGEMLNGTDLNSNDSNRRIAVADQNPPSCIRCSKSGKILVLRGFTVFPWNTARRDFVN